MYFKQNYRQKFVELLKSDLDFHDQESRYASHNFHSFPAKFPPQLPKKFILGLTQPGDVVLDPMNGSGTTTLEAFLLNRRGLGFDIDPLAIQIGKVKVAQISPKFVKLTGDSILANAMLNLNLNRGELEAQLCNRWDEQTKDFINYWFAYETQLELIALLIQIENIEHHEIRNFFELIFSAIVITKSGGVSLALDLAHTRPHKAKIVIDRAGKVVMGEELTKDQYSRLRHATKRLRSPIDEFEKRLKTNLAGIVNDPSVGYETHVLFGNAQKLPVPENTIDLIVTSPPYASNAIDYMRAHKFSLVWLGHRIDELGNLRGEYVGGDSLANVSFENMPAYTEEVICKIGEKDEKKALVLRRYYSEMMRVIKEMYRVLKPGKGAVVVVGSSIMRGKDTETQNCLVDIGKSIGFDVPAIGIRNLDRNRRMMPAGLEINKKSQIQQRMHEEYVIGFCKP